ncbi:hypothetical protein BDY24DRAFT_379828 [Mrakia frigida]|uniref:uncharacterized protein n=1 Tax=Mrakia frigida TaxID=29902 RepID=UPI003FCC0848
MSFTVLSIGIVLLATAAVVGGFPVIKKAGDEQEERAKVDDKPQVTFSSEQEGEEDKKKRKEKITTIPWLPWNQSFLRHGFQTRQARPPVLSSSSLALLSLGRIDHSHSILEARRDHLPRPSSSLLHSNRGSRPSSSESEEFDAMIHCGVASRFRGGVRIEQRGRRSGYISAGSDGLPAPKDGVENWAGGKEEEDELWTTVDAKGCRDWLEKEMGVEHITTSDDAGRYLCEFIYATSLSASRRSGSTSIPVLFVHVPDLRPSTKPYEKGDPIYTQEDVSEVLKRICWWVGNGGA